jgi:anti-sigma factor RsiW
MHSDHLTAEEMTAYRDRRLPAGEVLSVSDHLAACDACRAALARSEISQAQPEDIVPSGISVSYEEIADWLDDELDPLARREISKRLAASAAARAELSDLARFRDAMNAQAPKEYDESPQSRPMISMIARWALPLAAMIAVAALGVWLFTDSWSGSKKTVTLRDGGRDLAIDADGRSAALPDLPESLRTSIANAVKGDALTIPPTVSALAGQTQTLAGTSEPEKSSQLLEPVGTAVCLAQPHFSWTSVPNASGYRLLVSDERTGQLILIEKIAGNANRWAPGSPLPNAQTYQWSIEALRGDDVIARVPAPPEPEAKFTILPATECAALDELKKRCGGSHLAIGVADAQFGLLDDAAAEFRALEKENPQSQIPARLLNQVEAGRRKNGKR